MRKLSMIISIILISIILSIPTYAGTKKSEEDQISIRINEYEDNLGMGDGKTYFRTNVGDSCSLTKKIILYYDHGKYVHKCPNGHKQKWKSSKPQVVSVSKKGVIRAKKAGKAVITLKCGTNVCKLYVLVEKNSKKFLRKGKQLEKRIDALYKKYGNPADVNDQTIEKAITTISKLKSDCIYYGYEYCDKKGLSTGYRKVERRPKTTGDTYGNLWSDEHHAVIYIEDDGMVSGYILYANGWKMSKVAKNIQVFLSKKDPFDPTNPNYMEIQSVDVQKQYAKITLKESVTKEQVLGGLFFNGGADSADSLLKYGNTEWAYLLPQKNPTLQKIPVNFYVRPLQEDTTADERTSLNFVYMRGYYSLNSSVIECKPEGISFIDGKLKRPLPAGKYVATVNPILVRGQSQDKNVQYGLRYEFEVK